MPTGPVPAPTPGCPTCGSQQLCLQPSLGGHERVVHGRPCKCKRQPVCAHVQQMRRLCLLFAILAASQLGSWALDEPW